MNIPSGIEHLCVRVRHARPTSTTMVIVGIDLILGAEMVNVAGFLRYSHPSLAIAVPVLTRFGRRC